MSASATRPVLLRPPQPGKARPAVQGRSQPPAGASALDAPGAGRAARRAAPRGVGDAVLGDLAGDVELEHGGHLRATGAFGAAERASLAAALRDWTMRTGSTGTLRAVCGTGRDDRPAAAGSCPASLGVGVHTSGSGMIAPCSAS